MEKKNLFTFKIDDDGNIIVTQEEYEVYESNGLTSVVRNGEGWHNLPKAMYDRIYGENVKDVIDARRKWLIEIILPRQMEELKRLTDEIDTLSKWLNENSK